MWCSVKPRCVFLKSKFNSYIFIYILLNLRVKTSIMMNSVSFLKCGRWWPPWVAIRGFIFLVRFNVHAPVSHVRTKMGEIEFRRLIPWYFGCYCVCLITTTHRDLKVLKTKLEGNSYGTRIENRKQQGFFWTVETHCHLYILSSVIFMIGK